MKAPSLTTYQSKDLANKNVFTDKQTEKWTGQKLYAANLSMGGGGGKRGGRAHKNHRFFLNPEHLLMNQ